MAYYTPDIDGIIKEMDRYYGAFHYHLRSAKDGRSRRYLNDSLEGMESCFEKFSDIALKFANNVKYAKGVKFNV